MNRIKKLDENKRIKTALIYKTISDNVFTENRYYKTDEILNILAQLGLEFSDRSWRKFVEDTMNLFIYEYVDKMIVGSTEGYKLTNNVDDIAKFLERKRNQFLSLATNFNKLAKAMGERNNMNFEMINWGSSNDSDK